MGAVWLRFCAELRTRWRGWLGLAVLVGVAGGSITALAAGAARTDSAYDRFLSAQRAHDVMVVNYPEDGSAVFDFEEIARLPQVTDAARAAYDFTSLGVGTPLLAGVDGQIGRTISRVKLLEGRLAMPERAHEVVVSFLVAEAHGLRVGSTIPWFSAAGLEAGPGHPEFDALAPEDQASVLRDQEAARDALPDGKQRVVGIVAMPGGFPPQELGVICCVFGTPSFARLGLTAPNEALLVRLRHGDDDVPAFLRELRARADGRDTQAYPLQDNTRKVQRSIDVQVAALWLLAGLMAFAVALILAQLLARVAFLESVDNATLDALGMSRRSRWLSGLAHAAAIGIVGAGVAIPVALALSPIFPIGIARTGEPDSGLSVDVVLIALGAAGTAFAVVALAALPEWLAARVRRTDTARRAAWRGSRIAAALRRWGVTAPVSAGVGMALERGRGPTAVPVATSLTAATLGVVVVVGALTFGASLDHLLDTPRLYGTTWELSVFTYYSDDRPQPVDPRVVVAQHPEVTAFSVGSAGGGNAIIDGGPVGVVAFETTQGTVLPPIVEGRAPRRREIVLGSTTMRELDVDIGGTVAIETSPRKTKPFRVVGRGVMPSTDELIGLGQGALVTWADMTASEPEAELSPAIFLDLEPDANPDRVFVDLRDALCPEPGIFGQHCGVWRVEFAPPEDIVNFGRANDTPQLMALVLSALAVGTLTHVLVTAVRRRRRDLAVLKILGFTRRQVRTTMAMQTTTFIVIALLVALPVGVVVGRGLWTLRAGDLGIVNEPQVPWLAFAALIPFALLLANLIAALPARAVARTSPADVLRSE